MQMFPVTFADEPLDTQLGDNDLDGHVKVRASADKAAVIRVVGLAVALPLVLYLVLRPENYGLTPNGLDPVFYTGYSINLDDVLRSAGDRHYFVSRWSVYMPMHVADVLFGPFNGRLLWRLSLASLVLMSLWSLGRRWSWTTTQRILIGTLVLSSPIFLRAFFTDYVEYLVVSLGICLVCLCLRTQHRWWTVVTIGLLSGFILVANPISLTFIAFPLVVALFLGVRGWRQRVWFTTLVGSSALFVAVSGLLLFRWRYGIPNVYQPSIDFIRTYQSVDPDPWRNPNLGWLGSFTWLYMPVVIGLMATGLAVRRVVRLDRVEYAALVLCGVQFLYQVFDQFVRGGYGLELSLYWAYSIPSVVVAMAILVGRLSSGVERRWLVAVGAGWIGLLLVGIPDGLRLQSGLMFALVAVAVIGVAPFIGERSRGASLALLLALLAWMQIGAPEWNPSYFGIDASPNYDELIREGGNDSETIHDEAVWFADRMDEVERDSEASFVPAGGAASSIIGIYAAHVSGRWIRPLEDGQLDPVNLAEIERGARPILAFLGPPEGLSSTLRQLPRDLQNAEVLLDETHSSALGYRLVVLAMPDATQLPFTWLGRSLPISLGFIRGTEVWSTSADPVGYVTFGPYIGLENGTYRADFVYRSSLSPLQSAGQADIANQGGQIKAIGLPGTSGATNTVSITFSVGDRDLTNWQFRTFRNDSGHFVVEQITLSRV